VLSPPRSRGTVVLFHGYAKAKSSLLVETRAFTELGYTAVLVDFRGSGGSNGRTTTVGYAEADDVAAVVRHIRSLGQPGPLILFGQSMGGAAVLRAISVHGICPDGVILESVFDRMLSTVKNRFTLMGVPSFPCAELLVFWGGVQSGFSGFDHNPADYASNCECRVLMLHGEEDPNAKLAEAREIYDNLRGRREFEIFPGAGHMPLYQADPERWREAVKRFLTGLAQ
jgi:alpha-beta hydrolase superfamily lysophospholipase